MFYGGSWLDLNGDLTMINIKELSAAHCEGLSEWSNTIKKELGFSNARVKTPSGVEPDLFLGQMTVDELNNGALKIKIYSSSQQTDLVHKDCLLGLKKRIFIVNTCGSMLIRNEKNRKIICPGDSVIVPSWSSVIEESFSRRTSLSFIVDISSFADSYDQVKSLLWKNVSELTYGVEINKIISNFYNNNSARFCEKNMSALIGLLGLEAELNSSSGENIFCGAHNNRLAVIINYIKNNVKNPGLCLSMIATHLGLTERMVQYILSSENLKFHQLLSSERCAFLASKIRNDVYSDVHVCIFESGFDSVNTANRQFKKIYGLTPRQYQQKIKKESPDKRLYIKHILG